MNAHNQPKSGIQFYKQNKNIQKQKYEDDFFFEQEQQNQYSNQNKLSPGLSNKKLQENQFQQQPYEEQNQKQQGLYKFPDKYFPARRNYTYNSHKSFQIADVQTIVWPLQQDIYKYSLIRNPLRYGTASYIVKMRNQFNSLYPTMLTYFFGKFAQKKTIYSIRCYRRKKCHYICNWAMIYMYNKQTQLFELKYYNNQHKHAYCQQDIQTRNRKFKKHRRIKLHQLQSAAKDEQNLNQVFDKMKYLCSSTKIKKIQMLNQIINEKSYSLKEILKREIDNLKKNHQYKAYMYKQQAQSTNEMKDNTNNKQREQVLVFINPLMKHLYKNYSKVLNIERFHFIQKQQKSKYSLICFNGVSFNSTRVYFGIGVIFQENRNKLEMMFKIFFQAHKKYTKTIVISYLQKEILEVCRDVVAKSQESSKVTIIEAGIRVNFKKFDAYVINKPNIIDAEQNIINKIHQQINNKFTKHPTLPRGFFKNHPEVLIQPIANKCYDRYEGPFVGLSFDVNFNSTYLTNNFHRIVMSQMKSRAIQMTNSGILKLVLIKLEQKMRRFNLKYFQKQANYHSIQIFHNNVENLQKLRYSLSRKPFKKLCQYIQQSLKFSIHILHPQDFFLVYTNFYTFIVIKTYKKNPPLSCDCKYYQKSGLPCSHIIKVAMLMEINLVHCIDIYWIVNYAVLGLNQMRQRANAQTPIIIKRGRPKTTDKLYQ